MPPPNTPQPNPHSNTHFFNTILNPHSNTAAAHSSATPTPAHAASSGHTHGTTTQGFTAAQRSLQARGKNWNSGASAAAAGGGGGGALSSGAEKEGFEARQKRDRAAAVLESVEVLIWYSGVRNESVPQTRRHFQNIVLGIEDDDAHVLWREEWEVGAPGSERSGKSPRSAKGKEKERERGKKRVSSGAGP